MPQPRIAKLRPVLGTHAQTRQDDLDPGPRREPKGSPNAIETNGTVALKNPRMIAGPRIETRNGVDVGSQCGCVWVELLDDTRWPGISSPDDERAKNQQALRQLKFIINRGVECDLYTAQGFEALSGALIGAINGGRKIEDAAAGTGVLAPGGARGSTQRGVALCAGHRAARNGHQVASNGIQAVLAVEVKGRQTRAAVH